MHNCDDFLMQHLYYYQETAYLRKYRINNNNNKFTIHTSVLYDYDDDNNNKKLNHQ